MCHPSCMASQPERFEDSKRALIAAAAIDVFSAEGFSGTSMAHIAKEAGMSRPALYQYFQNKGDIFACAFTALVEDAADFALASLDRPGTPQSQLDGFLQSFDGTFWERTAASPYSEELLDAKSDYAPDAIGVARSQIRRGLDHFFRRHGPKQESAIAKKHRKAWIEILELAPRGFKLDQPSVPVYRRRLTALAESIASDVKAKRSEMNTKEFTF
ncbi:TetR/AcrR family transcriptional regulator [Myxococcota bacterium]|nr:TetR/AcrR family transcriptional regulator [Myxococcota bacterium]